MYQYFKRHSENMKLMQQRTVSTLSGLLQDAMKFLVQQPITMCCTMLLSKK